MTGVKHSDGKPTDVYDDHADTSTVKVRKPRLSVLHSRGVQQEKREAAASDSACGRANGRTSVSVAVEGATRVKRRLRSFLSGIRTEALSSESRAAAQQQKMSRGILGAIKNDDKKLFRELLRHIDPDNDDARGPFDESLLHISLLFRRRRMAQAIVREWPHIINDVYGSGDYEGESALHMAIVNRDEKLVRFLIRCGADVNTPRATGRFFRKNIGQGGWTATEKGIVYLGETPLHFAVCTDQPRLVKLLFRHGASMRARDGNGNTILHLAVLTGRWNMFALCKALDPSIENWTNRDGLTPFLLAAKTGERRIFESMLKARRRLCWRWGDVVQYAHPLTDLDTNAAIKAEEFAAIHDVNELGLVSVETHDEESSTTHSKGRKIGPSALELMIDNGHASLLETPLVFRLLRTKWSSFVRQLFWALFVFDLLLTIALTFAVVQRREYDKDSPAEAFRQTCEWVVFVSSAISLCLTVLRSLRQKLHKTILGYLFGSFDMFYVVNLMTKINSIWLTETYLKTCSLR
ncbi:MAG: hypothetical protein MHM6MM_006955 [Cercozoa sp. M6MM]